jgi:cell wall-associated NlpC family hydrolase
MKYGICALSIVPCRLEAADTSEMVSQLLFGEIYRVIDERKKWVKIRAAHDGYESWIDRKQYKEIKREEFMFLEKTPKTLSIELISLLKSVKSETFFPLVMGSILPQFTDGITCFSDQKFEFEDEVIKNPTVGRNLLIETAFIYLNSPYLWGGRTPFGIDCSGYSQIVYRMCGVELPRDASQQAEVGDRLSFIEEATPGDLAFFDNSEGRITHVGILLGDNKIIHASGKVRVDRIDHQGIFNDEMHDYSHHLRLITRVIK